MATFLRLIRKVSSHKELSAAVVLRTALLAMLAPGATLTRVSTLLARQSLERPPLTPLGSAIRSVLMVSMGSGYCNTGRSDWRGELPRYLAHFLPKARTYVTTGRNRLSSTCRPCLADIAQSGENHTFDCTGFLKQRPDLVLVFGSGNVYEPDSQCDPEGGNWTACAQAHYPSLRLLKNARLLGGSQSNQRPISVHFPVRKLEELHRNPFRFSHVVGDDSYFKPVANDVARRLSRCAGHEKTKTLMYVARYAPHKGQVEFVQRVDPSALGNYTVHFYGGQSSTDYARALQAEINRTGLNAVVHGRVPHNELLDAVCQSAGQIHTALFDNNPRAAYEALFAGNPLFISKASKTPDSLLQLPFVQPTDMSIEGGATMNTDFKLFMQMIEKDWGSSISRYANLNMNSLAVYSKICESIGLCTRRQNGKRISKASHSSQQVGKLLRSYNQSAISTA